MHILYNIIIFGQTLFFPIFFILIYYGIRLIQDIRINNKIKTIKLTQDITNSIIGEAVCYIEQTAKNILRTKNEILDKEEKMFRAMEYVAVTLNSYKIDINPTEIRSKIEAFIGQITLETNHIPDALIFDRLDRDEDDDSPRDI